MTRTIDRRHFLQTLGAGAAGLALLNAPGVPAAPAVARRRPPNILFINADQMNINALSGHGCALVQTPHIDRLMGRGTTFMQSYTTNPVCCPARSGWFSGRPSCETGAPGGLQLRPELPDLCQWLGARGYESLYAGKWHINGHDIVKSSRYLTPGSGMGENTDAEVSRAAQGFLRNYNGQKPFFLSMGFLQPHDICYWIMRHYHDIGTLPLPEIANELPPLPANFHYDAREPAQMIQKRGGEGKAHKSAVEWSELHWRYYLWSYYRHVEMVDAEVGRVLDALEDSAFARDTLVVFSVDHGEGMANHQMVIKGYLYDEAARVPLVISWPGQIPEGRRENTLASGMDFAPTVCDFAGAEPLPKARGLSLRPLLEGRGAPQREFIAAEAMGRGQMIRTARYKYIFYPGDPLCQLFDMEKDPGETRNLAPETQHASALAEMKKHYAEWDKRLEKFPGAPVSNGDEPAAGDAGAAAKPRRAKKNRPAQKDRAAKRARKA